MGVQWEDLELLWPPTLLAAEARVLQASEQTGEDTLGWLMHEAFHGDRGLRLYQELTHLDHILTLGTGWRRFAENNGYQIARPPEEPRAPQILAHLIEHAEDLPRRRRVRLFSQRQAEVGAAPAAPLDLPATVEAVLEVLEDLARHGYFADAFGLACPDTPEDPDAEGQLHLADALDVDLDAVALWPPARARREQHREGHPEGAWTAEELLDVVEALHDVVARPRQRTVHDFNRHYDYEDFTRAPGRALYRWRINQVLDRSALGLRLAEHGEDTGRLVHATGDDREVLLRRALASPDPTDRAAIAHAVALFRARDADREAKRSAVVALARVLEDRRPLLKREMFSKDEGALFHIANGFDLRHRTASQADDYDEAFLDWIYWVYLVTVELSDRLLARARPPRDRVSGQDPHTLDSSAPTSGSSA